MWKFVRIPKGIALAAFFLPWLTVSCSGQKVMSASGWNLVTGNLSVTNPMTGATQTQSGDMSFMLLIAFAMVLIGFVLSFRSPQRAKLVLGTSLLALVSIWIATEGMSSEAIARKAAEQQGEFDAAMASMIRVDWHLGYWLANLALVTSAVTAGMVVNGRSLSFKWSEDAPST